MPKSPICCWHGLAAGMLLIANAVLAGERLPDVVVSASRSDQGELRTGAGIVVLSRDDIERSGAANLADLLRGRGGIQVSDSVGDGSGASVAMRGLADTAASNTLILVDGRRLNNPDIAVPALFGVPLANVERVEIIQGSAGSVFGDQAVGGVINVITRAAADGGLDLRFGVGSYAGWRSSLTAALPLADGLDLRVTGEHRRSDNYRDNNRLRLQNLDARLEFNHEQGLLFADLQSQRQELGTPGALFADEMAVDRRQAFVNFANDYSNDTTGAWRLGMRQALGSLLQLEAEWMRRDSDVDFLLNFRSGFPVTPGTQSRRVTEFTPRLVASLPLDHGDLVLTLGYDRTRSRYRLNSSIGDQRNHQSVDGTWLQAILPLGPGVELSAGYRHARVENDLLDSFTFTSPTRVADSVSVYELGLSLRPAPGWRLFARRDGNFRFAKVDEFTDPPPGVVLDTQQGVSWEAGLEWRSRTGAGARATLYRLDLDQEIAVVPGVGAFNFPANTNIDRTRRDGLILGWDRPLPDGWQVSGSYDYIDARILSGPARGRTIPMVPRHSGRLAIDYRPESAWSVGAELQAVDDRVFSGDLDNVLGRLPGHALLNLSGGWEKGAFSLLLRVNNALNLAYSDYGAKVTLFPPPTFNAVDRASYFPAPERNLWLTLAYRMD